MFQIKRETDYAIQLLKVLDKSKRARLSLAEISSRTNISFHFLQKIARKLRMARIVKGEKGVDGGYCLNKNPENITLKMIIEAMEGSINLLPCYCANKQTDCVKKENKCELKSKMKKLNGQISQILKKTTLKQL